MLYTYPFLVNRTELFQQRSNCCHSRELHFDVVTAVVMEISTLLVERRSRQVSVIVSVALRRLAPLLPVAVLLLLLPLSDVLQAHFRRPLRPFFL